MRKLPSAFQADPTCPTVTDPADPAYCRLQKVDALVKAKAGVKVNKKTADTNAARLRFCLIDFTAFIKEPPFFTIIVRVLGKTKL